MSRFIAQARLIKLPDGIDDPDDWSSATSRMTQVEVSQPFDATTLVEAVRTAALVLPSLLLRLAERYSDPGYGDDS